MADKKIIEPGKWFAEFDEKGNVTNVFYDVSYRKLLGVNDADANTNSDKSWTAKIHPDDVQRVEEAYIECLQKHPEGLDYDIEYRMMTKNGYHWFHDYGLCTRRPDGSLIRCDGVVFDIQATVDKDKIHEEIKKNIIARMSVGQESLYIVNPKTEVFEILTQNEHLSANYPANETYTQSITRYINNDVYEPDRKLAAEHLDIHYIAKFLEKDNEYVFKYRDISFGIPLWYEMQALKISDTEIIYNFKNKNKDTIYNILQENNRILEGMTSEYTAIYQINLDEGTWKNFVSNNRIDDVKPHYAKHNKTIDLVNSYIDSDLVHPDSKQQLHDFYKSDEDIKEKLANKKSISARFLHKYKEGYLWTEMTIVKCEQIDKPAHSAIVGFVECDSEVIRDQTLASFNKILEKESAPDDSLNELLAKIAEFYEAERAYIFEYGKYKETIVNTYEWCAHGIEPMKDKLQNIAAKEIEGWIEEFKKQGAFSMDALDEANTTPEGREILEMQGIESLIAAPILKDNEIIGFIGVDNPKRGKHDVSILRSVAIVVRSEILRRKENDEEHITLGKLTDAFVSVYFVDLATDYMRTWKIEDTYREAYGETLNYSISMGHYVWNDILESERERAAKETTPEFIREQFKTKERFSVNVTDIMTEHPRNIVFDYIKVNEDGSQFVLCSRDVTVTLKEQIEQQRQLQQALKMAESANKAKTVFLNNMSHDIRTPMNAIIGYTELAKKNIHNEKKMTDFLQKIDQSSNHLLSLINDVLDMSRIESGKISLKEKEENIHEIITSINDIVQNDIHSKHHTFTISTLNLHDDNVICDKLRLNQVLLNILSNSIKYTKDGGHISFTVKESKSNKPDYANYEFCIKDNGIGMDKEFLKTIFDPFTRVQTSTVSGIQGTGLGMAITKKIIDMMGGTIEINSIPEQGTEMIVCFTFKNVFKSENSIKSNIDYNFKGKKILLVEDNELNRDIATQLLEDYGMQIDTAEDGYEAVEKIKNAGETDYDLVLMDVQMPVMNGYEATKKIRSLNSKISKIPIIAMTANAFEEDKKLALEAGMNDHIAKPIDIIKLKETLANFL